ncbi:MAG: sarcosine oxidase subunit gamma [Gammaproteobacteria bacterium]|nr:sarcosine oxidase subunit gamma [Gammaproteobacteria bacterium]MDH3857877.1 sarcosine oxidase subunit gamma [Gammaproteobacteria bacterium]
MSYEVDIQRLETCALIDLQGAQERIRDWVDPGFPDFPTTPNTAVTHQGLSLYWLAPEKWLLRAPAGREDELQTISRLQSAPVDISIVLVSDTLQFFSIEGTDAEQIVAIASPLDTHAKVFPENGVSYTEVFGLKGLLIRIPGGFEIAVESSFADMIEDYLARTTAC